MKTGSDKLRIHEGSYLLQILQKVGNAEHSDSKSEDTPASWVQKEIKLY